MSLAAHGERIARIVPFALLLVFATCHTKQEEPSGFGINLTIGFSDGTLPADLARVELGVSGVETFTQQLIPAEFKDGVLRTRYVPLLTSGSLTFRAEALSIAGGVIARGSAVTDIAARAVDVTLVLDRNNTGGPVDAGPDAAFQGGGAGGNGGTGAGGSAMGGQGGNVPVDAMPDTRPPRSNAMGCKIETGHLVISDFDDGAATSTAFGTLSGWFVVNDTTGIQQPTPAPTGQAQFLVPEASGACGTPAALHSTGKQFTGWGASVNINLKDPGFNPMPVVLSPYKTIRFWLKGSVTGARVFVRFSDKYSDPAGGVCSVDQTAVTNRCFDKPQKLITLSPQWQYQDVALSALMPQGWGMTGQSFFPPAVYGLEFQVAVDAAVTASFDLWIDEVSLLP